MKLAFAMLILAGVLVAVAIALLAQQGSAHAALALPASGSDFALGIKATGWRAILAMVATALAVVLFFAGLIRGLGHLGNRRAAVEPPPAPPAESAGPITPVSSASDASTE